MRLFTTCGCEVTPCPRDSYGKIKNLDGSPVQNADLSFLIQIAIPCSKHGGGRYEAGDAPHAPGSDTSQEAARLIAGRTNKICKELLYWFSICHGGLTVEEAAEVSKIPRRTVAPRLTALQGAGLIHDSGERRKLSTGRRAVVWKLSPKGGQHVP